MTNSPTIAAELREIASRIRASVCKEQVDDWAHELLLRADALEAQRAAEHRLTIQRPDGTYGKKTMAEMLPDDMVVFDGPESELELLRAGEKFYRSAYEAAQAKLDAFVRTNCQGIESSQAMTSCSDERPCLPCFTDVGTCVATPAQTAMAGQNVIAAAPLSMSMFASKANYDKAMGDTVPCNAPTDLTEQPVEVVYTHREDWHAFTSPQLPGLWVSSKSLREACADVEPSIKLPQRLNAGETPTDLTEWQRELMRLWVDPRTKRDAIEYHAALMVQRVAKLGAELKEEENARVCSQVDLAEAQQGFATLQSRCEAAEEDAARMQWLDDTAVSIDTAADPDNFVVIWHGRGTTRTTLARTIREAIDAAIAAAKERR